ncbi:lactosylceramide 4-alpha-galactosyltransferase-like [Penaeus monodon]|uniref:lactosylceramide 4-alpha-galactosyltransferase-like n=1 Tax=Penaeus monodon TaxID=6687 RepID=UPI0018A73664|nr:lactosylceramide 4-alpha-galactosyltransferase-like [Penaeus monodon]
MKSEAQLQTMAEVFCVPSCSWRMGSRFFAKLFVLFVVFNSIWIIYPSVVQWREALSYGKFNRTDNGSPQRPLSEQRAAGEGGARGMEWWQKQLCKSVFIEQPEDSKMMDLLMLSRDIAPNASDYNVYLAETGCNPRPLYRAWCSVESFALQNPTAKVWYLITSPQVDDTDALVTNLRKRYGNLNVVGADLDKMFTGTPVEKIFKSGKWARNTPWPANNISNLLRNVVLWLWGGMNDTDDLRQGSHEPHNVGHDEGGQRQQSHHAFDAQNHLLRVMRSEKHFPTTSLSQVSKWHVNGPGTATAVTKQVCNATNMNDIFIKNCSDVTLLPLRSLQIVRWNEWKAFFKGEPEKFIETHKDGYIMHMYNKLSKETPIKIGSKNVYDHISKTFCPVTYIAAKRRAFYF